MQLEQLRNAITEQVTHVNDAGLLDFILKLLIAER